MGEHLSVCGHRRSDVVCAAHLGDVHTCHCAACEREAEPVPDALEVECVPEHQQTTASGKRVWAHRTQGGRGIVGRLRLREE